ncbi:helix-turn-helix domain-containing protein [Nocardioides lijunqiniae]|uniref:helix-turn-helix domain-containing protein n=1 Tax=Nocardioides lijunqiniae TaxID=2760832 RepID=UPI001878E97E|nr:helix-turn-helix domain-containing protein [Nocardioides lijunqiniae]
MILNHAHGVVTTKCKHPECVKSWSRYLKRWRYDRSHGLLRLTDPTTVRLHIATLQGAGWSMRAIAAEAGTSPTTISRYMSNSAAKVSKLIVERVMSVDPSLVPSKASTQTTEPFVPRTGTVRRIQALMAMGYSHTDLAARGIDSRNLLNQQGRWVTRTTHDQVAQKYRQLCRRPGPTERSIREAAKRGYLGPAAWDDIDRDPEPDTTEEAA